MRPFHVTILGCSSATPTTDRHPSAQILNVNEKLLLIDCGEGTQIQLLKYHIRFSRIQYIFISHLHGDHILGLPGLLSTMSLNGRNETLHLFAPAPLEAFLKDFFNISNTILNFEIDFHPTNPSKRCVLFEHIDFTVESFPLNHRVDCTGFIVTEKYPGKRIRKDVCEALSIPLQFYGALRRGEDIIWNGMSYSNDQLAYDPPQPRKYIYCSDTLYMPSLKDILHGANLVYHESTFLHEMSNRAKETYHTTAKEAATLAKEAEIGKLLLGHFSARYKDLTPILEEAIAVFPNTDLALEGETYYCV